MESFIFYSPTKIIFGRNTEQKVGSAIKSFGGSKVLLIYGGKSAAASGLLPRVEGYLKEASLEYSLLGGVVANPKLDLVRKGINLSRNEKIDFLLALGGASVIDSAKAIAMGTPFSKDVWEIYKGTAVPECALPVGSILTIAAAGSESSAATTITNEEDHSKISYRNDFLRPKFAIMNPELTFTLPGRQIANGTVDILMHTMERYFASGSGASTDAIAEAVMRNVIKYGKASYEHHDDYEARSEMMWLGSVSHNDLTGLGKKGDWTTHGIARVFSALYDAPHGPGLSSVWDSWARYVFRSDIGRFISFGNNVLGLGLSAVTEKSALKVIYEIRDFFKSLDMPVSISELLGRRLSEDEIDIISRQATSDGKKTVGTLQELSCSDLKCILRNANKGFCDVTLL